LDILSHSGDIRDQSRKLAKIAPDFANFLPQFLGDTPEFWTCIIKRTHISITWQSFTVISRRSSEILWRI